jgi:HAD superfamily hydrolase (TIGR01450 family)
VENDPQAVVVGLDPEFTYNKLAQALWHLQSGCQLVACNQDKNYPIENGRLMPGCGSIVAAILGSYDKQVDFAVGKPNTYMMELLSGDHGLTNQDILVVGDSLATDIEMANRFGCQSILVTPENNLTQLINLF